MPERRALVADDVFPGDLYVVIRGRFIPREIHRHSPFDGMLSVETMDAQEDRSERGCVYRVLSAASWPIVLCVLEWHPEMDEGLRMGALRREIRMQQMGDIQVAPELLTRVAQSPQEYSVQQSYLMSQRMQAEAEQRRREAEEKAEAQLRKQRPRMQIDFTEIKVRLVDEDYLRAARAELQPRKGRR